MFLISAYLQNAACFLLRLPGKPKGATDSLGGLNRVSLGRKEDVSALTLSSFRVSILTSRSGSALSLSSKTTSASPSSPLDLPQLHSKGGGGGDSGWQAHGHLTGVPPPPADTADG